MTPMEKSRATRAQECFERMANTAAELGRYATDFAENRVQSASTAQLCRRFVADYDTRHQLLDEIEIIRIAFTQKEQGMDVLND